MFALAACSQGQMPNGDDNNDVVVDVPVPEYGYILFNADVASRGTLYEGGNPEDLDDNRLYQNFGVIGYTYMANEWTTAVVQATPMTAFYNKQVVWNKKYGSDCVYTYNGGKYEEWVGKQHYAFFAYAPWNNNKSITPSSNTKEGNPYIDFKLPSRESVENHVDVMTGCAIDTNYATRSVGFNMSHRLTALDITANNLYDEGSIYIKKLKINIKNLLYDEVRIPLNDRDEPELVYGNPKSGEYAKASYTLIENGDVEVPTKVETALTSGRDKTMIFIPQNQHEFKEGNTTTTCSLIGTLDIDFSRGAGSSSTNVDFVIKRDLKAGRRYFLQVNFAPGDISVFVIESDEWKDSNKIYHDFE